jgi:small subunit ribosomal protein S17
MARGKKKTRIGVVVSDKMDKTVVVSVMQIIRHPKYKKPIKRLSKFKAHDEGNRCRVGDKVLIIETRPLSRTKRWRVSKILERKVAIEEQIPEELSQEGGNVT